MNTSQKEIDGVMHYRDAKGGWMAESLIKPADLLEAETVHRIIGFAQELSDQVSRFKGHTMTELGEFDALLEQEYGLKKGGKKGNRTYRSFDDLMRVEVRVADFIAFGPQLQIAKELIDECLTEWSADSRPEIRAIITRAFNTDKEGQVNRSDIFMLLRMQIEDERWNRAMDAIRDAMRVVGTKEYVRFQVRKDVNKTFNAITIDIAKAE